MRYDLLLCYALQRGNKLEWTWILFQNRAYLLLMTCHLTLFLTCFLVIFSRFYQQIKGVLEQLPMILRHL